jgi:hypothetical protein
MRFFERNQTALRGHPQGEQMRERMFDLLDLLKDQDAPLTDQLKSSLAIFALHATWFVFRQPEVTDEERQRAALQVALELIGATDDLVGAADVRDSLVGEPDQWERDLLGAEAPAATRAATAVEAPQTR